jgi:tyrosine-protein kinase Etk/Wzc
MEKKKEFIDYKSIINKYLYHWPLFITGILITSTLAFLYLSTAKPQYEIKASLLIQDQSKSPDQDSALHEIDFTNSSKIIENEVEILKSNQLLNQVVNDLELWIVYRKKEDLTSINLYKVSPVHLDLLNSSGNFSHAELNIIIKDNNSFLMTMPSGKLKEFFFKNNYESSFGTWHLEPTSELTFYKGATINIIIQDPNNVTLQYQKLIDASLPNKLATTIELTLNDENAIRGKDILNSLISNYNLSASNEKKHETQRTLDFLDLRIDSLATQLTADEKGIEGFKSSRGLTDITNDSQVSLENMQTNASKLNDVNVQLSVIDGIEKYLNSPQNSDRVSASLGIDDPTLNSSIAKLNTLQLEHDKLLATTPETNPDFELINNQIRTMRAVIRENVKNIKSSLENSKAKLEGYNSTYANSIKSIPTDERQYTSIKRQQTTIEGLYTYLLKKREELTVSYASIKPNDHIVDAAYVGSVKGIPTMFICVIAFLLGIGLPTSLIYTRNYFNKTIKTTDQLKSILNIPIAIELPYERGAQKQIVINDQDINPTTEQFRALRTKLNHIYGDKKQGRVTLITSSVPNEGKSFVSSNLGVAMAYAMRKTILIELDMRKPKIAEIFNLPKEHLGLSDFIMGNASESEIIQSSGVNNNLDVISCGLQTQNPAELLEQDKLYDLISYLKNNYVDVLIDSPPVHLVPDAMIFSKHADLTLYVIRQGVTKQSELSFLKDLIAQNELPNVNLIFNGIERVKFGYGYNYVTPYYNSKKNYRGNMFSNFSGRF